MDDALGEVAQLLPQTSEDAAANLPHGSWRDFELCIGYFHRLLPEPTMAWPIVQDLSPNEVAISVIVLA